MSGDGIVTAGQWEQYVEAATDAMLDCDHNGIECHKPMGLDDTARAVLAAVGPRIAEDTRDRLVAAAAAAVARETRGLYYCPASGEIELSGGSGGFIVCCDRVAEHQPITAEAVEAARKLPLAMKP